MKNCLKTKYNYTKTIRLTRLVYYFSSLIKIYQSVKFRDYPSVTFAFLFPKNKIIYLKKYGLLFRIYSLLDILTLKEVVLDEEYESLGVSISSKNNIIVDIGAGFGDFSIMIGKRFPNTKIYAFEPDSRYFRLIEENLGFNGIQNVFPVNKPIFDLKTIFQTTKAESIDFLKMDCEGCEFDIINKRDLVYLNRVRKVVMEYHEDESHKVQSLKSILEKAKFKVAVYPRQQVDNIGLLTATRLCII